MIYIYIIFVNLILIMIFGYMISLRYVAIIFAVDHMSQLGMCPSVSGWSCWSFESQTFLSGHSVMQNLLGGALLQLWFICVILCYSAFICHARDGSESFRGIISAQFDLSILSHQLCTNNALPSTPNTQNMGIISAAMETKRIVVMWARRIIVSIAVCLVLGFVGLAGDALVSSAGTKICLELELFLLLLQACYELVTLVVTLLVAALQVPLSFATDAVRDAVWDWTFSFLWDAVWALMGLDGKSLSISEYAACFLNGLYQSGDLGLDTGCAMA